MAKDLEELQESDVIFAEQDHRRRLNKDTRPNNKEMGHQNIKSKNSKLEKRMGNYSLPVNVPDRDIFRHAVSDDLEEDGYGEEMVPPHVITGRRAAGKMAYSVCTGNGRTLKGRDLSQVRNSILRMTGFLET
ncbi:hypothetical protein I3842_09G129900 [Carya illinoinensis]|uniref:Senescence regulator n=1 Tax=Carya illinoinensis TaxID=32201 RepID=A0A922E4R0_CARIL|nr:hypothetical protein I3842_09G129900 [Carya illinoinensis]